MSTSQTTGLSEPVGADKISVGTLGYICARNRQRQYNLVIKEFKRSGITQADLGRRLCKSPEVISRLLARPANWEADTFAELLFGISGAVAEYQADHPLRLPQKSAQLADVPKISTNRPSITDPTMVFDTQTGQTGTDNKYLMAA